MRSIVLLEQDNPENSVAGKRPAYVTVSPAKGDDGLLRVVAKIERTTLGLEDHGLLTAWLHVSYGGSGQGIGGFGFDRPVQDGQGKFIGRVGRAYGMEWVRRALLACGVDEWERLTGRTIYALKEQSYGGVRGIEPLPTERGERFLFADLHPLFASEGDDQ